MRHFLIPCILVAALVAPVPVLAPVLAHESENPRQAPKELLEQATRDMMRIFEMLLQSIPQYQAPEILENGDIIIRRVHPKPRRHNEGEDEDKAKI